MDGQSTVSHANMLADLLPLDATGGLCPFEVHHAQHSHQLAALCDAWHDTIGTPQDRPKGCQDRLRGGQL